MPRIRRLQRQPRYYVVIMELPLAYNYQTLAEVAVLRPGFPVGKIVYNVSIWFVLSIKTMISVLI